jgi:hypothetical protein
MHAFQQRRKPARGVPVDCGEVQELYEGLWIQYNLSGMGREGVMDVAVEGMFGGCRTRIMMH